MKKLLCGLSFLTVFFNITLFSQVPPPPVYLGLSDSNSTTPKLLWSRVPTATSYGLRLALDTYFYIIIDSSGIVDTFYQLPQGLPISVDLYLHLRSINLNGNGPWSIWYLIILHSQEGIKKISNTIPDKYNLSQNYPNPFNPKTIINFQLPMFNNVKVIIYNVLGRIVATLVNQQLQPGTYEVEWDATNYPSGVYFYKLNTRDFSETKRMVLIK